MFIAVFVKISHLIEKLLAKVGTVIFIFLNLEIIS
jgi:hypothetical protein